MAIPVYDGDPRKTLRWWEHEHEPPRVAVWELTLACDQACGHCGSRAGQARADELSTAECLDLVNQLAALGVREVTLIGGEAYLRDDWVDIAHAITAAGMACTMVTGGRGFDAWRVEEALAAGVRHIGVSIDGLRRTHDAQRGDGSFDAAVAAARRIAATRSLGLGVNTQINRLTLPELRAVAELIAAIGAHAWQVQLTVALGRAADRPELLLQPFELLELFPLLVGVKREILEPAGIQLFAGNNIGYFGPYERELRYGGEAGHIWGGCGAGRSSLGIEANGAIKGCPSLPTRPYTNGNIRDAALTAIAGSSAMRQLGRRTRADLWGYCAECEYGARCLGGCTWTSHALLGRPGNNPFCHHRALVFRQRGLRERIQLAAAAPGRPFDHGRYDIVVEPIDAPLDSGSPWPQTVLAQLFPPAAARESMWSPAALRRATAPAVTTDRASGRRVIKLTPVAATHP